MSPLLIITIIVGLAYEGRGRPVCLLAPGELNSLMAPTVDETSFGVEPAVGLGLQDGRPSAPPVEAVIQGILAKNSSRTAEELRPCVEALLAETAKPSPLAVTGTHAHRPPGLLNYNTPWYFGGSPGVGVPIPDDDEYKPGSEGYTTYINPHNFLEKVKGYVPAAYLHYTSYSKLLADAYSKLSEAFEKTINPDSHEDTTGKPNKVDKSEEESSIIDSAWLIFVDPFYGR